MAVTKIHRRQFCIALGATCLLPKRLLAAQTEVFSPKIFRNSRNETLPYRLFTPQGYNKQRKYPLVLWLHGGAGRGDDNLKQISGGNTIGSHVWTLPANQAKHPCFVVAPQCPEGEMWASLEGKPDGPLRRVLELLETLKATFSLDAQKFYVTGQSLGGFGTWSLISEHPRLFAAAVPVCGGGDVSAARKLTAVPVWAFHGENDNAVSVQRSREMIAAIKQAGGTPRYTEYKGAGHAIWETVFNEPELLPWVFAQTRSSRND
jgi:predicted peptidase